MIATPQLSWPNLGKSFYPSRRLIIDLDLDNLITKYIIEQPLKLTHFMVMDAYPTNSVVENSIQGQRALLESLDLPTD